jgi:glutamate--cysteine ligase
MVESQEDPDMSDSASGCTEQRSLVTEAEVEALVRGICFKTGPPRVLGVELEWHVHELRDPRLPATPARLEAAYAALRSLPLASSLTIEPGGQLELSSAPAASLMECVESVSADLDAVRATLREMDLGISGFGHDPWNPPTRFLREPRYDAMEVYLDRFGPEGRSMMCSSASVQVCIDAGYEEPGPLGHQRRWWLTHQCCWPRSRTPRWRAAGSPAGVRLGSRCGLRWTRAGRRPRSWTATPGVPGRDWCWTRR